MQPGAPRWRRPVHIPRANRLPLGEASLGDMRRPLSASVPSAGAGECEAGHHQMQFTEHPRHRQGSVSHTADLRHTETAQVLLEAKVTVTGTASLVSRDAMREARALICGGGIRLLWPSTRSAYRKGQSTTAQKSNKSWKTCTWGPGPSRTRETQAPHTERSDAMSRMEPPNPSRATQPAKLLSATWGASCREPQVSPLIL